MLVAIVAAPRLYRKEYAIARDSLLVFSIGNDGGVFFRILRHFRMVGEFREMRSLLSVACYALTIYAELEEEKDFRSDPWEGGWRSKSFII